MRELKFRVWNNRYNEFIRPDYGLIGFCYPLDGRIAALTTSGEPMEDWAIEQYTGLKDKNGKEIYEGDIIQEEIDFNSKMTDGTFRYMVYWDEEELCWCLDHIGNESIHHELWQCNQSTEVIGNIHENPELRPAKSNQERGR